MKHKPQRGTPNYIRKLDNMIRAGLIVLVPGMVTETVTRHDDWCDMLQGKGKCNCDPDIEIVQQPYTPN